MDIKRAIRPLTDSIDSQAYLELLQDQHVYRGMHIGPFIVKYTKHGCVEWILEVYFTKFTYTYLLSKDDLNICLIY